jgi:hypothetical protein
VTQQHLFQLGCLVHRYAGIVLFVGVLILASFCVGLKSASAETKVDQLWVEGELIFSLSFGGYVFEENVLL